MPLKKLAELKMRKEQIAELQRVNAGRDKTLIVRNIFPTGFQMEAFAFYWFDVGDGYTNICHQYRPSRVRFISYKELRKNYHFALAQID